MWAVSCLHLHLSVHNEGYFIAAILNGKNSHSTFLCSSCPFTAICRLPVIGQEMPLSAPRMPQVVFFCKKGVLGQRGTVLGPGRTGGE